MRHREGDFPCLGLLLHLHSPTHRLPPHSTPHLNRMNRRVHWVSWMWCYGVKRPFTTRKWPFMTVLPIDINDSLVIWVIYSGGYNTVLYWRIECGGSFVYVWIGHVMINETNNGVRVQLLHIFCRKKWQQPGSSLTTGAAVGFNQQIWNWWRLR